MFFVISNLTKRVFALEKRIIIKNKEDWVQNWVQGCNSGETKEVIKWKALLLNSDSWPYLEFGTVSNLNFLAFCFLQTWAFWGMQET